jgi:hypothetical protein
MVNSPSDLPGIITKADSIGGDTSGPYGKLIAGTSTDMGAFTPEHGWSPLRLRTYDERATSDDEVHMIQACLFTQPHWAALAKETGKAFGIDATAQELSRINESAVLQKYVSPGLSWTHDECGVADHRAVAVST